MQIRKQLWTWDQLRDRAEASSTASLSASQSLSGWPEVTDGLGGNKETFLTLLALLLRPFYSALIELLNSTPS
jgi:hypothetical protein